MLVLSRKTGEVIRINDDISIRVVRISWDTVRIGIEAPRNIKVLRGELSETTDETGGEK